MQGPWIRTKRCWYVDTLVYVTSDLACFNDSRETAFLPGLLAINHDNAWSDTRKRLRGDFSIRFQYIFLSVCNDRHFYGQMDDTTCKQSNNWDQLGHWWKRASHRCQRSRNSLPNAYRRHQESVSIRLSIQQPSWLILRRCVCIDWSLSHSYYILGVPWAPARGSWLYMYL